MCKLDSTLSFRSPSVLCSPSSRSKLSTITTGAAFISWTWPREAMSLSVATSRKLFFWPFAKTTRQSSARNRVQHETNIRNVDGHPNNVLTRLFRWISCQPSITSYNFQTVVSRNLNLENGGRLGEETAPRIIWNWLDIESFMLTWISSSFQFMIRKIQLNGVVVKCQELNHYAIIPRAT